MKKWITLALVLVLSLSLLAACGGCSSNSSSNSENSNTTPPASTTATDSGNDAHSANLGKNVILPSQLITLDDAKRLLGEGIEVNENFNDTVTVTNAMQIEYFDTENQVGLGILFYQDAVLDEWQLSQGGAKNIGEERKAGIIEESESAVQVEGIGDWAVLNVYVAETMIRIGYGDYYIQITSRGRPSDIDFSVQGAVAAWKTEFLTEAGELAVERLKAITK